MAEVLSKFILTSGFRYTSLPTCYITAYLVFACISIGNSAISYLF